MKKYLQHNAKRQKVFILQKSNCMNDTLGFQFMYWRWWGGNTGHLRETKYCCSILQIYKSICDRRLVSSSAPLKRGSRRQGKESSRVKSMPGAVSDDLFLRWMVLSWYGIISYIRMQEPGQLEDKPYLACHVCETWPFWHARRSSKNHRLKKCRCQHFWDGTKMKYKCDVRNFASVIWAFEQFFQSHCKWSSWKNGNMRQQDEFK